MPRAIRLLTDPSDPNTRLIFWNNGRLEAAGSNPPPQPTHDTIPSHSAGNAPIDKDGWFVGAVVTDWTTPSGYTISKYGQVFAFGTADEPTAGTQPVASLYPAATVIDLVMDPAADGTGYALLLNGTIRTIGGAVAISSSAIPAATARRIYLRDWTTKEYVILDAYGRWFARHGAPSVSVEGRTPGVSIFFGDYAKGAVFYTDDYDGWMLDKMGGITGLNDGQVTFADAQLRVFNHAYWADLALVDDGTGADPLQFTALSIFGTMYEIIEAGTPTVTVEAPDDPVNDTTRPTVVWSYSNDQGDQQDAAEVKVYTDAQYLAGGFDPDTSEPTWETSFGSESRGIRSVAITQDLANDTYRAYVRAKSTADVWSAWAYLEWDQDVAVPEAPTLTVTPGDDLSGTLLDVEVGTLATGAVFGIQWRDDPADPWRWVLDGDALTPDVGDHASVSDPSAPFGIERTYRALQYVPDPLLLGDFSTEETATIDSIRWTLIDPYGRVPGVPLLLRGESDLSWTRFVRAGVFHPAGRADAVVTTDGGPGSRSTTVPLRTYSKADYDALETVLAASRVLLLRDPLGRAWYVTPTAEIAYTQLNADAGPDDDTSPVAHLTAIDLPFTEVARPLAGPSSGALALLD